MDRLFSMFWGETSSMLHGAGLTCSVESVAILLALAIGAYFLARHEERSEAPDAQPDTW